MDLASDLTHRVCHVPGSPMKRRTGGTDTGVLLLVAAGPGQVQDAGCAIAAIAGGCALVDCLIMAVLSR